MSTKASKPIVREAHERDLPAIAAYLAPRLKGRGGERRYRRFWEYRWLADKPNLGCLIEDEGRIGGFIGAIYARRIVGGQEELFCNLSSWHVDDPYRNLSLALAGRLLAQPACTFTTCSPSERVIDVLKFFKFRVLDPAKVVFTPGSGLRGLVRRERPRVFWGRALPARLTEAERRIHDDHGGYRCGHFLVERGAQRCYFVTVRRGRGLRAFADVLYASDPALFAECIAFTHLPIAFTHGTVLTGIDRRLLRAPPVDAFVYSRLRPTMFRSSTVAPRDVDTLYSELVPMYG